jgi:hypothetical protein
MVKFSDLAHSFELLKGAKRRYGIKVKGLIARILSFSFARIIWRDIAFMRECGSFLYLRI